MINERIVDIDELRGVIRRKVSITKLFECLLQLQVLLNVLSRLITKVQCGDETLKILSIRLICYTATGT